MSFALAIVISMVLLAMNAFFVAAEFALIASKRYRLERLAAEGSTAARSAVRGHRELSVMLAGAQLGITLCTLGLGALLKPAVADVLDALFTGAGAPGALSYGAAFLLALLIEVFLHLVLGEMMPKSWAIAHPERSALLLSIPFRAYAFVARPLLAAMDGTASGALKLIGVPPQRTLAQAHGPEELGMLLRSSREEGLLPRLSHELLDGMLRLRDRTVADLALPRERIATVAHSASTTDIERASLEHGCSRLVVTEAGEFVGTVHVRDALRAEPHATAAELMIPPFTMQESSTVDVTLQAMRTNRVHLALVTDHSGRITGLVSLEDLLEQLLGDLDAETGTVH